MELSEADVLSDTQSLLAAFLKIPTESIIPESRLQDDLGIDSVDALDIFQIMQQRFAIEIAPEDLQQLNLVQDIVELVLRKAGME